MGDDDVTLVRYPIVGRIDREPTRVRRKRFDPGVALRWFVAKSSHAER
jgi:hypothetical protein